ncbi:MAG TPA: LytTR family transcriptional regulator DNA-binding domain-containing protein [Arachidicoccus soli]|uniref:Response regulator n=1 Tax=Arachidicoccus soli TaxID=2341117 RepID=A0A386HK49_9BACT|nr:LytTR family transcriptional regulator DNA-binding domain-containing protein [Arachidicoccus soli]AYD46247.1 response regulator [Arachidicoccus soli]HEU0228912.1 LytTR family transcriptional regulator DNA-binding domain-containing protein [Arachidicoccus soli]
MRTIIIDDEPLARSLLLELLEPEKDIEIVAECGDGFEALKAIQEHQPDLIFLDIQMPKITGFEMLELLESPPRVIFTTAYDEYALKAFEVNALDYLLKPLNPERLTRALQKLRQQTDKNQESVKGKMLQLPEQMQRIVVKVNGNIKILPLPEVFYLESADDYVKVHTNDKYYLKHQTMNNFEQQLPIHQFVRVHRSCLVNVQHIHKVDLYEKDQYCVVLRNDVRLPVSRSGYAKLKTVLGI